MLIMISDIKTEVKLIVNNFTNCEENLWHKEVLLY